MNETSAIVKKVFIVSGVLFLLTIVASILVRSLELPVGFFVFLNGLLLLVISIVAGKKQSSGQEDKLLTVLALGGIFGCIIGLVFIIRGMSTVLATIEDNRYTKTLNTSVEEIISQNRDSGEKYVVYDVKQGVFRRKYLSDKYRADAAEDIAGVLILETDYNVVGHYSSGDEACKYVLKVTMKLAGSDEIVSSEYIYGDEPPKTVSKSIFSWDDKIFGSLPSDQKIRKECDNLIDEYLEDKARRERVVLMSEDEMLDLFHRIITENADADGWIAEVDMFDKIEEEQPDFRMKDYPYSSREFFADHSDCFETKQGTVVQLGMEFPALLVKWIGN